MTGKDLLDAIGAVDEELLEHCQKTEQITAKNKISWFWHDRKYVSIAACACLLCICILGITYWQYNFSGVGDTLMSGESQGMIASTDTYRSETAQRLPETDERDGTDNAQKGNISNGTDADLAEDTRNETDQNSKESSIGSLNDNYQLNAGVLPDKGTSSGMEGVEPTPKESESTNILASKEDKPAKVDETGGVPPNYSQGIKIKVVKKIPEVNSHPSEASQPGENPNPSAGDQPAKGPKPSEAEQTGGISKPAGVISAKNIFAQNTVVFRGTVKKIQHFHATGMGIDVYFSVVSVKVKEAYRADGKENPQKGKTCKVYLPAPTNSSGSGNRISDKLAKGSEVVLMPYIADTETGIRKNGNFFAFLDVSDYYFDAKSTESHLFLKTKTGVLYDTKIYDIPYTGKKVTLDDVGNYIRKMFER